MTSVLWFVLAVELLLSRGADAHAMFDHSLQGTMRGEAKGLPMVWAKSWPDASAVNLVATFIARSTNVCLLSYALSCTTGQKLSLLHLAVSCRPRMHDYAARVRAAFRQPACARGRCWPAKRTWCASL